MNSASYADMTVVILRAMVLLFAVASGACAARGGVPRPFPGAPLPPSGPEGPPDRIEAPAVPSTIVAPPTVGTLISTALEFIGAPYRNGGSDPSGFDCSGFVQWVFGRHGLPLPREVRDQYQIGSAVDLDEVREGDLLFFETVARGASHVGIALGHGRFVHAPSSKGVVRVEPYTASYWARRFVGARRVSEARAGEGNEDEEAEIVRPRVFPGWIQSAR